jgi:hypothetical protein
MLSGGSGTSSGATQVVIALGTNEVSAIPFAPEAHPPPVACCGTSGCAAEPHRWYNLTFPRVQYPADPASRTPRGSNVTHPAGACARQLRELWLTAETGWHRDRAPPCYGRRCVRWSPRACV